jgi:Fe-S-cluster containining protein
VNPPFIEPRLYRYSNRSQRHTDAYVGPIQRRIHHIQAQRKRKHDRKSRNRSTAACRDLRVNREREGCPGYCCMTNSSLSTLLLDSDITTIANHLEIPHDQFITKFVILTNEKIRYEYLPNARAHIRAAAACPFLRQGQCRIHRVKPKACRDERPTALNDNISCAEWHKVRLGWM